MVVTYFNRNYAKGEVSRQYCKYTILDCTYFLLTCTFKQLMYSKRIEFKKQKRKKFLSISKFQSFLFSNKIFPFNLTCDHLLSTADTAHFMRFTLSHVSTMTLRSGPPELINSSSHRVREIYSFYYSHIVNLFLLCN